MADFRRLHVADLKWFPLSRKLVPVTPVRVQFPPCPCSIHVLPGRYCMELALAGHAAHPAFVEFVRAIEEHAQRHASRHVCPSKTWFSALASQGAVPTMKLNAFSDAKFYDAGAGPHPNPTDITGCSCLAELQGAWVSDTCWGLRWKVLEVKASRGTLEVPCLLGEASEDSSDSEDQGRQLEEPTGQ